MIAIALLKSYKIIELTYTYVSTLVFILNNWPVNAFKKIV